MAREVAKVATPRPVWCHNARDKLTWCLGKPDLQYTQEFTESESGEPGGVNLYFCSACGPEAKMMSEAIEKIASGPRRQELVQAIEDAQRKERH